jgi:hypothetical protein
MGWKIAFTEAPYTLESDLVAKIVVAPAVDTESQWTYQSALAAQVGVIGWVPNLDRAVSWYSCSDRTRELVEGTAGYVYEGLLNSGRSSNIRGKSQSREGAMAP